jgi:hypothetical protein
VSGSRVCEDCGEKGPSKRTQVRQVQTAAPPPLTQTLQAAVLFSDRRAEYAVHPCRR